MVGLFVRVDLKNLTNTVVVIPLLEKFFLVSSRVPFNKVLQLRQVCSEQDTATHGYDESRKIIGGYVSINFQKHPIWKHDRIVQFTNNLRDHLLCAEQLISN
jgi:hypothetical protein